MSSRQSVNEWVAGAPAGGEAALAARRRGRRQGEKTVLAPWQQAQVAKAIREKNPDQLRLPGFLWTRALGLRADRSPLRDPCHGEDGWVATCASWGFSPQKPARRALEQHPELVAAWLDERYPEIELRAHREKALVLWADEMGLRSDHTAGRSWSPVGPDADRPRQRAAVRRERDLGDQQQGTASVQRLQAALRRHRVSSISFAD